MPETARACRINIVQVAQPEQPGIVQIVQPTQPKQPSGLHIMCGSRAGEGCTATGGIVCRIGAVVWRVLCAGRVSCVAHLHHICSGLTRLLQNNRF